MNPLDVGKALLTVNWSWNTAGVSWGDWFTQHWMSSDFFEWWCFEEQIGWWVVCRSSFGHSGSKKSLWSISFSDTRISMNAGLDEWQKELFFFPLKEFLELSDSWSFHLMPYLHTALLSSRSQRGAGGELHRQQLRGCAILAILAFLWPQCSATSSRGRQQGRTRWHFQVPGHSSRRRAERANSA